MTELERQLMKALKEWGEQYEQGQKRQAGQVEALGRQVSSLTGQVEALARQLETFAEQYEREQQEQAERVEALTGQAKPWAAITRSSPYCCKGGDDPAGAAAEQEAAAAVLSLSLGSLRGRAAPPGGEALSDETRVALIGR